MLIVRSCDCEMPLQDSGLISLYHDGQRSRRTGVAIPAPAFKVDTARESDCGNSQYLVSLS
jgi:hypothetical protein